MLVSAGSVSRQATSPSAIARSRASGSLIFTTFVVPGGDRRPHAAVPRHDRRRRARRRSRRRCRGSSGRTSEPGASGDLPGEPQREPVGVGGGDGELPVRQAEPAGELLADPDRVLRRKHRGDAARRRRRRASAACGGACPVIAPVSPRHRSTYSMPSTSVNRAPTAVSTKTGNDPATASSRSSARRPARSCACSASDEKRGCTSPNRRSSDWMSWRGVSGRWGTWRRIRGSLTLVQ